MNKCSVEKCDRPSRSKGMCSMHYYRVQRTGEPGPAEPLRATDRDGTCAVAGCTKKIQAKGWCRDHYYTLRDAPNCAFDDCGRLRFCKGWCKRHYEQLRERGGDESLLTPIRQTRSGPKRGTPHSTSDGYVIQHVTGRGNVGVHRLVMEERLGRRLRPEETVHHVNGDRADNRPENLELWTSSHPSGQRVADKLAWAREILALYANDPI